MADELPGKEAPVLTTRIDGEDVRLLVHIERLDDAEAQPDEPPATTE